MATIGTFKKTGNNEFTGQIVTLSVQAKNVRIVPETTRSGDNSPSHRVYVGRVEIGAAWAKRSNEGRDYLGLKLDDPSFTAPIFANLFDDEDGEGEPVVVESPPLAVFDASDTMPCNYFRFRLSPEVVIGAGTRHRLAEVVSATVPGAIRAAVVTQDGIVSASASTPTAGVDAHAPTQVF